ncbi:nucleoside hydrolase [Paenibacillus doosanensis]|uniref:Pyrimidine-specific ribonucleoside hydrolase RihB n=1 Tax=Paenibacillus konkukensis TaxID=2020716 RepID=A0ABY4RU35_9BACL|nr:MULTISPECIES: nucleoside hydrolase [Paenibacillus]MCS7464211.1 nucleoside hydrolase [Paenibacillus doosanensis]UQZ85598.1 Pyrimidine-specific ribonucleoside hydrolase RihB [Paenibacillus konkukensis]
MNRIILDTDIGTDSDDAVALSLALRSPEIKLEGVTTVYGNVHVRANIARKIMRLSGDEEVAVYPGVVQTLLRNREVFWAGIEGEGLDIEDSKEKDSKHAVDYIIETVMNNPGEITLVPIGPLTNIAAAIIREPAIAKNVKEIAMMGGVVRLGSTAVELPPIEHNVKCDPEAASVVFGSGAPILMVGLDVTRQVSITREDKDDLAVSGTPLAVTLTKQIEGYMDYRQRDFTYMHDPLAVALLINRELVTTRRMSVRVDYDHRHPTGITVGELDEQGNVEVCLEVDRESFLQLLKERVFS